jgi:hypothetical protein
MEVIIKPELSKPLSLSDAGKCRLYLWLKRHGYQKEEPTPQAQRTFDYGDAIEMLVFEGIKVASTHEPSGFKVIGQWWDLSTALHEPILDLWINPSIHPIRDRQREVKVGNYKGHIDGVADVVIRESLTEKLAESAGVEVAMGDAVTTVVDSKSANGYSYDRACRDGDLSANVFSREYVISQNMYLEGVPEAKQAILVYANKEHGPMMFRLLPRREELVEEGLDRLRSADATAEPRPDWDWEKGKPIPLRCSYCEQKWACSQVRGQALAGPVFVKGKPQWMVMS